MAERQTPRRPGDSGERRQASRDSGERRQAPRDSGERRQAPRDSGERRQAPRDSGERRPTPRDSGQRRTAPSRRNDVIRCENCGEDYSITYRRCPFCDERPGRGGISGKRVANTRGGGYGQPVNPIQVAGLVVSLILIVSAMFIVFRFVGAPIFGGGRKPNPGGDISSSQNGVNSNPGGSNGGSDTSTPPANQVQSITLSKNEFTMDASGTEQLTADLLPAGAAGDVIWSSSDVSVATVDGTGLVTNVNMGSETAQVTITATCGDVTAEAVVHCKPAGGGTDADRRGTVVNAEKGVNVRSGPGTSYEKVASLTNGSRVTVLGEQDGWYHVRYSNTKEGYVSKDYISVG